MNPQVLPALALLVVIGVSGCVSTEVNQDLVRAQTACELLCKSALQQGQDLSDGPCLDEDLIEDWVCDIAHSPRQAVDDLPENQCPSFGVENRHFVELDENCVFIQAQ